MQSVDPLVEPGLSRAASNSLGTADSRECRPRIPDASRDSGLIVGAAAVRSHLVWVPHAMKRRNTGAYAFREADPDDLSRSRGGPLLPELHSRRRPARGHPRGQEASRRFLLDRLPAISMNRNHQNPIWRKSYARFADQLCRCAAGDSRPERPASGGDYDVRPRFPTRLLTYDFDVIGASNGCYDLYLVRVAKARRASILSACADPSLGGELRQRQSVVPPPRSFYTRWSVISTA